MTSRPASITLLAILVWLAGAAHVFGALQDFGYLPAIGGEASGFFVDAPIEGIIQVVAAMITLFVAGGLWGMQSWARRAIVAIAAINIMVVFFTHFGGENWLNAVPGILINAAILLYARSPKVRLAMSE